GDDVAVVGPAGDGPRFEPSGVGADEARPGVGGGLDHAGIPAGPGVVDEFGAGQGGLAGDLAPPRVDGDDQLGVGGVDGGDEGHDPVDLLGHAHLGPLAGLDAADVDDVGAVRHRVRDGGQGRVELEGGSG